jgi:protein-S-isoprenylcysteine O-methyltransferase Ste14
MKIATGSTKREFRKPKPESEEEGTPSLILRVLGTILFTVFFTLLIGITNVQRSPLLWCFLGTIFFARLAEVVSSSATTLRKYHREEDQSRGTTFIIAFSFFTNAILPMMEYRHGLINLANFFVPLWGFQDHPASPMQWWNWPGLLSLIAGAMLRLWAIRQAGEAFTPHVKADAKLKLVTDGPYAHLRHPSYLGTFLSYLGIAVIFSSVIGAIALLGIVTPALILRIRKEEALLANRHSEAWKKYQAQTPARLVPGVW